MADDMRCITRGAAGAVPEYLRNIIWYMFEVTDEKERDCLQAFFLEEGTRNGSAIQKITHILKRSRCRREYLITVKKTVWAKIYVKSGSGCSTMFLEEELEKLI
jgi:hypothetical protein